MNNSASSAMSRQWRKRCGGPSRNHRYDIVEVCQCLAWPDVPGARQTICCRRLNPSIRQMLIPQTSYFFRLRSWDDASALGCACLTISVSVRRQARPVHSKLGTRMRCANFIGRVGPLAFALGVGIAVATSPATAFANPADSGSTTSADTSSSTTSSPATESTAGSTPDSSSDGSPSTDPPRRTRRLPPMRPRPHRHPTVK
jgi:hypothetical protein